MKHGVTMLVCLAGSLAVCTSAIARTADGAGNPYQAIVERNVFGLKAPPPPPDPEANKPPPAKITLTGITTILGNKRALMKMTPPPTPGSPPKEQSFTLGEGQRDGELEVLAIDENAGTVKVNNSGTITTLNWEDNGVKTAAAPAPGGAPKLPGAVPAPAGNPFAPRGGAPPFPTARPLRLPTPTGAAVSPASGGPGSVTPVYASGAPASAGSVSLAGLGASANPSVTTQPTTPQLSLDERVALYEAMRVKNEQAAQAGKRIPRMPPHPLAAGLGLSTGADAPAATPAPAPQVQMPPLPPGAARQFPQ